MERKIIFRGRTYNGSWVYGDLCMPANRFASIRQNKYNYNGVSHEESEVIGETIGQFTGLQDKNGKDIYEGDILMCIGDRSDNKGKKYYRSVLFKHGSFCMTVPEYNCLSSLYNHVVNGKLLWEVVGNIYDNKDLLED